MTDVSRYGGACLRKTLLVTEHMQWSTHIAPFTHWHLNILCNCSLCEFLLTVGHVSVVPVSHLLHVEDCESRSSRGHWGGKEHRHRNRTVDLNFIYNLHLSVLQWHLIIVHNLHYPPCRAIRRLSKEESLFMPYIRQSCGHVTSEVSVTVELKGRTSSACLPLNKAFSVFIYLHDTMWHLKQNILKPL